MTLKVTAAEVMKTICQIAGSDHRRVRRRQIIGLGILPADLEAVIPHLESTGWIIAHKRDIEVTPSGWLRLECEDDD